MRGLYPVAGKLSVIGAIALAEGPELCPSFSCADGRHDLSYQ